jgi:hypothetical protein
MTEFHVVVFDSVHVVWSVLCEGTLREQLYTTLSRIRRRGHVMICLQPGQDSTFITINRVLRRSEAKLDLVINKIVGRASCDSMGYLFHVQL